MIVGLIRLKTINEFTNAVNPTSMQLRRFISRQALTPVVGDLVQVCLWSVIEVDVGVICPCLPSFRLILRRLIPRIAGTTGAYEMGTGPTGQSGTFDKSAIRKGGVADGNGIMVVREVVVTPDPKDKPSNDSASTDGRSCASATELVFPGGSKR
jgi:hypothetical protein